MRDMLASQSGACAGARSKHWTFVANIQSEAGQMGVATSPSRLAGEFEEKLQLVERQFSALGMNRAAIVAIRRELAELGRFPPDDY